jgi:hypothetical protein
VSGRFEAGKTAAVDVSTAAGAGAAQGSTGSAAGTGMAQDGVDAMTAVAGCFAIDFGILNFGAL